MLKGGVVGEATTNVFAQVIVVTNLLWLPPAQFVVALPAIKIISCVETRFNALYGVLKLRLHTNLVSVLDVVEVFVGRSCVLGIDAASLVSAVRP